MGHVQALPFFGRSGIVGYHRHHRRLRHHHHHHQAHVKMQFDKSVMPILKRRNSVPCAARLSLSLEISHRWKDNNKTGSINP